MPELVLNVAPPKKNVVDKGCKVFHYRVQIHPLDVKFGTMEDRNIGDRIPYHDTFASNFDKATKIQAGCQVLATGKIYRFATIDNPTATPSLSPGGGLWSASLLCRKLSL